MDFFRDGPLPDRILLGALAGAGLGVAFLGIGLLRLLIFLVLGGTAEAPQWSDLPLMAGYIAAFSVGGAILGAVRPLITTRRVGYAAAAAIGACVTSIMGVTILDMTGLPAGAWVGLAILGAFFGLAGAWGFYRG